MASLRYAPNGNFSGSPTPWSIGFNLADCGPSGLGTLPAGVKGLVWIDGAEAGLTSNVRSQIDACKNSPNLYGFYIADEPDPASVDPAKLKQVSDYIHLSQPGKPTFIVLYNEGSDPAPKYSRITPQTTGIDLFGLDPYPCRNDIPFDVAYIDKNVQAAQAIGLFASQIVPIIQCFAEPPWLMPTDAQEIAMLAQWDKFVPTPAFEYVYSWGVQTSEPMTAALQNSPSKQAIFKSRYSGVVVQPPPPPPPPPAQLKQATQLVAGISSAGNVRFDGTFWTVRVISADGTKSSWVPLAA